VSNITKPLFITDAAAQKASLFAQTQVIFDHKRPSLFVRIVMDEEKKVLCDWHQESFRKSFHMFSRTHLLLFPYFLYPGTNFIKLFLLSSTVKPTKLARFARGLKGSHLRHVLFPHHYLLRYQCLVLKPWSTSQDVSLNVIYGQLYA